MNPGKELGRQELSPKSGMEPNREFVSESKGEKSSS